MMLSSVIFPSMGITQTPIRELQNRQGITVSGEVKSIVGNQFILEDSTGQIIVDAGPRWWHSINLSPGERVTVIGEMERDELDAFSITRNNGAVIEIRSPQGRPPWAGQNPKK
ncbi:NirD/YgiW/YdeI family stress tolerance protein [Chroococcus sp. FPU101]|uniref:NirD/YgiW/YdeI family stress tolerance protein n=1 Tax=Chroococcus sp. FPU101 TaxID=1974212 RepID=UPI001F5CBCC1|nr:NirD/YgiW/YdeI family stress tolerance protein [Chroococcus sp. FPU101]